MTAAIADFLTNVFPFHMFYSVQLLIVELMFMAGQKKRSYGALRIVLCIVAYLLICYFHPIPGYKLVRVLFIFFWSILLLFVCLNVSFKCCVFIAIASYAIQNLAFNAGNFVVYLTGMEKDFVFYLVTAAIFTAVYIAGYFLVVRRFTQSGDILLKNVWCFVLAAVTILVVYVCSFQKSIGLIDDAALSALLAMVGCALTLVVQFGALKQSYIVEQNNIIEHLLAAEKSRHEMLKENVDIINMKCHDLRYHIDEYRKTSAGEHDRFFDEMEKAVMIYDNFARTGNNALDVLLSEKLLYCGANDIDVSYMVDASVLADMEISDVYSLFGNALDNAIQSVMAAEKNKRIISLTVKKKGGFGQIVISNYCETPPEMEDGLPVSPRDRAYHGFGVRSIRYIVEKYGGSLVVAAAEGEFTLSALLPLNGSSAAA